MTRFIGSLVVLLTAQIALIAVLLISGPNSASVEKSGPLLAVDPKAVNSVVIRDRGGAVEIAKIDDVWRLPDLGGFEADPQKVKALLSKLSNLARGLPVADTQRGAKRLAVSPEDYRLRIELYHDDRRLADVFFGESPALRRIYARKAEENEVYEVLFENPALSSQMTAWIAQDALDIDGSQVEQITLDDIKLVNDGAAWALTNDIAGREINHEAVRRLVRGFLEPDYDHVTPQGATVDFSTLLKTAEIRLKTREPIVIKYASLNEKEAVFRTSNTPHIFRVRKERISSILEASIDRLTRTKNAPTANKEE